MIIKNRQFRSKFLQNSLTPKGKPHSSTPRMGNTSVLSWNWSISKFVGQYQHTLKLLFMNSYTVYQKMMALKGWHISKFSGKNHIIWVIVLKIWRLLTQLIIFEDFGAKILEIARPVNYSYLPPWNDAETLLWHWHQKMAMITSHLSSRSISMDTLICLT